MYAAYTPAFATPFQFGIQGIQYGIQNGQYSQDGKLHNVKIQGICKRKCCECNNYGFKVATIGISVTIKMLKQGVLGLNPWRACLNETNLLLRLLLQCEVHF